MTDTQLAAALLLFPALPLLLAGISVLVRRRGLDRILLLGWPLLQILAAGYVLYRQQTTPVLAHHTGGFDGGGVAISIAADPTTSLLLLVTGVATLGVNWFLIANREDLHQFMPGLLLVMLGGVNGALMTADLFNLFVFVEVMLLPSYALISISGGFKRIGIGRMFVIVNLVTSTILVMGVGLVYAAAGAVNLGVLAGAGSDNPSLAVATAVVLLALTIKAGAVPVHGWLPNAYPGTSAGMMALFSGLHTKVGVYAVMRIYFTVFDTPPAYQNIITVIVLATMILGALISVGQKYGRGIVAYQMVSGVGHILLAVVVGSALAVSAGLFYLIHHIITVAALLLLFGALEKTYGPLRLDRLSGLMRQEPVIAFMVALGLLSLAGLPPTSGLWGKVFLMFAAADSLLSTWLISFILVASLFTVVALIRLWNNMFFGTPRTAWSATGFQKVPTRLVLPGTALILVSVGIFVFAGPLQGLTEYAANIFTDTSLYQNALQEAS